MEHNTRKGEPRLLHQCLLPLTAVRCVDRIYTDIAVVEVTPQGFLVTDILEGMTRDELQARTGATLTFAQDCRTLTAPPITAPD